MPFRRPYPERLRDTDECDGRQFGPREEDFGCISVLIRTVKTEISNKHRTIRWWHFFAWSCTPKLPVGTRLEGMRPRFREYWYGFQ